MSRRPMIAALLLGWLSATPGCALGRPATTQPAPIVDTCLVGAWTMQEEVNTSGYTLNNVPVPVKGLAGATLKFSADGQESENLDGSAPLIGTTAGGDTLSITIGGSFVFGIHAADGKYTETGDQIQVPTSATVNGMRVVYHSSYGPGSGTYVCTRTSLTMVTRNSVQTDMWSKE